MRLKKTGRDIIELHWVSIATTPCPLAASQEGFPSIDWLGSLGGRLKQYLPVCQLLTVKKCSHIATRLTLRVLYKVVKIRRNTSNTRSIAGRDSRGEILLR